MKFHSLRVVSKNKDFIVLNRNGSISVNDKQGRELERYPVPQGAFISVPDGDEIAKAFHHILKLNHRFSYTPSLSSSRLKHTVNMLVMRR